jgi:hypothetical protein
VRKKPRGYVDLLAKESAFINAVIDMGVQRSAAAVSLFARGESVPPRRMRRRCE